MTRIPRRFGTVALSNYNNQWMYFVVFFFTSWLSTGIPYQLQRWWATFLTIALTYLLFGTMLYFWEKTGYFLSLEWIIRTITNNVVPARKRTFDSSVKWWQRGLIDVQNTFYDVDWINLDQKQSTEIREEQEEKSEKKISSDSQLALIMAIVGLCSILFSVISFVALPLSIYARKQEGRNKQNIAASYISAITIGLFISVILVTAFIPIGSLGIF
jgi:hypothetical protein